MATELKINHTLEKKGLFLYKFPVNHEGKVLSKIYVLENEIEIISLNLDTTDFTLMKDTDIIRQAFIGNPGEITARYT